MKDGVQTTTWREYLGFGATTPSSSAPSLVPGIWFGYKQQVTELSDIQARLHAQDAATQKALADSRAFSAQLLRFVRSQQTKSAAPKPVQRP